MSRTAAAKRTKMTETKLEASAGDSLLNRLRRQPKPLLPPSRPTPATLRIPNSCSSGWFLPSWTEISKSFTVLQMRIGKVESRQSVFNRLGASPKEVKRKSVHERLGPVAIVKKHTKSPLGTEPSKEIKSAVPSRMRREADVNVLCGEVLKARPKIIVHTSVQEENEESMKSSYATYQDVQDVEAPKNWRVIAWP
nr:uncharacterized protein LOC109150426 [Ipomoea batatas]